MPYTAPNTFTAGTPIVAADLQENLDTLRKYLNKEITGSDIDTDSLETLDIVKHEAFPVNRSAWMCSSDVYTIFYSNKVFNRSYITGETKMITDLTDALQYQLVPNASFDFYTEGPCYLLLHGYLNVVQVEGRIGNTTTGDPAIVGDRSYISISGYYDNQFDENLPLDFSYSEILTEDIHLTDSGAPGVTFGVFQRRCYPISSMFNIINPGHYKFAVVINCTEEKCYAAAKNLTLEIFYL